MSSDLVFEVNTVSYAVHKSNPPTLLVQAEGLVNSTGWKMPKLEFKGLADRVLTYEFRAEKPEGMILWVMTKIHAEATYEGDLSKVDAIKVIGAAGDVEIVNIADKDKLEGNTIRSTDDEQKPPIAIPVMTRFKQREKVSDLIGLKLRVLKEGGQATFDLRSDRVNVIVDSDQRITKIWFS